MLRGEAKVLRDSRRPPQDAFEAYLQGLILADGHVGEYATYLRLGPDGEEVLRALASHFNLAFKQYHTNQGRVQNTLYSSSWPSNWKWEILPLPHQLELSRLRGLLDGDGCITFYRNRLRKRYAQMYLATNRSETEDYIRQYFATIAQKLGVSLRPKWSEGADNTIKIFLRSQGDIRSLCRLLYADPAVSVRTKRERALEVLA